MKKRELKHPKPERMPLYDERVGITHHFSIHASDERKGFYITSGLYPDGKLGEIFITVGREGSLISAALDGHSTAISIGLQYGVPLECYTRKMRHTQFEPSGYVEGAPPELSTIHNNKIYAKSPFDYIAMYLEWKFPDGYLRKEDRPNVLCNEEIPDPK